MRVLGLLTLASVSLLGQDVTLVKEGDYWVRTISGVPALPAQGILEVYAPYGVVVKGSPTGRASFKVIQRVRAASEKEARALLGEEQIVSISPGYVTNVVVNPRSALTVKTDLQLNIPRQMQKVNIGNRFGAVEATDLDGQLLIKAGAGPLLIDRIGGFVDAQTGGGEIHVGRINGSLHCVSGGGNIYVDHTGGEANCDTAGGEIVVKESGGRAALWTDGGNISIDRAGGAVNARSAEGLIEVLQAAGIVTAQTRAGAIEIGSARGVKAESAMGQVRVKGTSGPLRISTAAGAIMAELMNGMILEDSSLVAGAGDITVFIPSNLSISVVAASQSNGPRRIYSDFNEVRVTNTGMFQAPVTAQGSINGGGPMLNLSAASGVIFLKRK
jgi:hypothetical protein